MSRLEILRIGHSPDPDDAFMFYAITNGIVHINDWVVEHVLADIETLNRRAMGGDLEVTAISVGVYPWVADRYRGLRVGASVGFYYGPKVLTRSPQPTSALVGKRIAVPGAYTTAFLLARLCLPRFEPVFMDFTEIPRAVAEGRVDAGIVIHEAQITFKEQGLCEVLDLGYWWTKETGLPIPLGFNVVRRDLGEETAQSVARALKRSIQYALDHMDEALTYAMQFGRGMSWEACRRFVMMYVNSDTVELSEQAEESLRILYEMAFQRGLVPQRPPLDLVA